MIYKEEALATLEKVDEELSRELVRLDLPVQPASSKFLRFLIENLDVYVSEAFLDELEDKYREYLSSFLEQDEEINKFENLKNSNEELAHEIYDLKQALEEKYENEGLCSKTYVFDKIKEIETWSNTKDGTEYKEALANLLLAIKELLPPVLPTKEANRFRESFGAFVKTGLLQDLFIRKEVRSYPNQLDKYWENWSYLSAEERKKVLQKVLDKRSQAFFSEKDIENLINKSFEVGRDIERAKH